VLVEEFAVQYQALQAVHLAEDPHPVVLQAAVAHLLDRAAVVELKAVSAVALGLTVETQFKF
jgi:hypothetical protein